MSVSYEGIKSAASQPLILLLALLDYSTEVFVQGGFTELSALAASLGFGVINWLFVSTY
jgi:hypothetical protein